MKNTIRKTFALLLVAFTTFAYATEDKDKKAVKTTNSTVVWKGYKVTGSHTGTIKLKSGALEFEGDKLTGGTF